MKILKNAISNNSYIQECDSTTFTVLFNDYKTSDDELSFVLALIKYPEWNKSVDIFRYLDKLALEKIKSDDNTFFLFDASTEGFSTLYDVPFFDILYYNCKKYNVPHKKIIFTSTNLLDEKNIKIYNKKHSITNSIHVFTFLSFRKMIKDLYEMSYETKPGKKHLGSIIKNLHKSYDGKFILSLSRTNRFYRTLATYMLYMHDLGKYSKISHDKINEDFINTIIRYIDTSHDEAHNWLRSLPLVADTLDFETNHALHLNSELHHDTLFQIVNETHVDNWNNTSLFYSEKTFRSMIHFQPFVIYGQQGCNNNLRSLGFKTYNDWVDYGFDDEPNPILRYQKLLHSLSKAFNKISNLSKQEQIQWRFKNKDVLMHNFNLVMSGSFEKTKFRNFIKKLKGQIHG